jgi:hypothetical protein
MSQCLLMPSVASKTEHSQSTCLPRLPSATQLWPRPNSTCFRKVILRWATEKCPLNDCTAPNKWLSWRRDDSQPQRLFTGRRCMLAHLHSPFTSPGRARHVCWPLLPIWNEVAAFWQLAQCQVCSSCLYYSILGKHLETKWWLSPVMYVVLSKLKVLNKSQWILHKPWLLIYLFDTNWMYKSIRKLASSNLQDFTE